MAAAAMELAHAAEMAGTANTCSAEMTSSSANMRATEMARTATVESTAATEMRATTPATTHMNASTAMPMSTTTARTRVGRDGQSCQEGRRYDRDFEKVPHGSRASRLKIMCKHSMSDTSDGSAASAHYCRGETYAFASALACQRVLPQS